MVFGIKKKIQAQQGKVDLVKRIEELEKKKATLKKKEIDLKSKRDAIEKRIKESQEIDEQKRSQEKSFLSEQFGHLNSFLKGITEQQNK